MPDHYDLPFYYCSDLQEFSDGQSYSGLSIPIDRDAEFRLRAIFGVNFVCTGGIYLYDGNGKPVTPAGHIHPGNQPLLIQPEIVYPPAGQIRFNIHGVLRARRTYTGSATTAYYSTLAFYGVKRFRGDIARRMQEQFLPNRSVREAPYWIRAEMTVGVRSHVPPYPSTQESQPGEFRFPIDDRDFVLFAIGAADDMVQNKVLLMPYDSANRQLSTHYLPASFLAWQAHRPWACFPSTPVFYPANSVFRIGWKSRYIDTETVPASVPVTLLGARRMPC